LKRIGIIGCGAIGSSIARAIDRGDIEAELVTLMDIDINRCTKILETLARQKPVAVSNIDRFLELKPDIVVEAASHEAVKDYAHRILMYSDMVILSVGALLDSDTYRRIIDVATRSSRRIYIPSGAIGGLDILRIHSYAGIKKLKLVTRKPASSLGVRAVELVTIYRGRAGDAIKLYPRSLNIAATISIATGFEAEVEVIADPNIDRNIHEIEIESTAGRAKIVLENIPSPENPRTSYLAILSTILLLKELCKEGVQYIVNAIVIP